MLLDVLDKDSLRSFFSSSLHTIFTQTIWNRDIKMGACILLSNISKHFQSNNMVSSNLQLFLQNIAWIVMTKKLAFPFFQMEVPQPLQTLWNTTLKQKRALPIKLNCKKGKAISTVRKLKDKIMEIFILKMHFTLHAILTIPIFISSLGKP